MKDLTLFLLCILAIFTYILYGRKYLYLSRVKSEIDENYYFVRNLHNKQEASNKLSELGIKLGELVDKCNADSEERKRKIEKLKKSFNRNSITENIPGSLYAAYSVNKGEELSICIRDKKTEEFIDNNTLMFVCIHELSHIMSDDIGHTTEFWDNMKYLLLEAEKVGLYQPVDYSSYPKEYCGELIDSTPLNL